MRDLYRGLSLTPTASVAEIKAAITACPHPELRSDAAAVLLHEGPRRTYDQLHATLTRIGSLRASLGLVQTRHWQEQRGFDGEITGNGSRYGEFIRKREQRVTATPASRKPTFVKQSLRSWLRRGKPVSRKP